MTKKQRQKVNNARKRRYRSIVNLTGDSKLASKLRGWSDERILKEYGITTKKKITAIKKPKESIAKRNLTKALLFHEAITQESYRGGYIEAYNKPQDDYKEYNDKLRSYDPKLNTQKNRREQWRYWSNKHDKFMPKEVKSMAEWLNNKNGYDINAHYGYAVIYYAYLYGVSIEEAEKVHKADRFQNGDIYKIALEL